MNENIDWKRLGDMQWKLGFSGSIHVQQRNETLLSKGFGFADRSNEILNQADTRFSIASGSKIFTSATICRLVEDGKLTFDTKIIDCLDIDFPYFDEEITIHHLLTHTSGVPDYFDEDEMEDYEELWKELPMYRMLSPKDLLPMFQNEKMDDAAGCSFKYNNAGYIILGLVVEQTSGMEFADYIEKYIFKRAGMNDSGYFSADELPGNVATGYIEKPDGTLKSNIFSLPAKGGPDGGAYVTAADICLFWEALRDGKLLSEEMMKIFLKPQESVAKDIHYGYSGYMETSGETAVKYIQMGYDPGVNFRAVHYPDLDLTIAVCSNESDGAYEMLKEAESLILYK